MKRVILTIISILMMLTGPFLMFLAGPQLISWAGLALFIHTNKDWLIRFKWFRKLKYKLDMKRLDFKLYRQQKLAYKKFKKGGF